MIVHLRNAVMTRAASEALRPLASAFLLVSLAMGPAVTGTITFLAAAAGPQAASAAPVPPADAPEDPDAGDDDESKIRRPVRVGDLIGADVIAPVESQDLLGHVTKIVQTEDGPTFVVSYGGHFGFGARLVCVPEDALYLTGRAIQAKGIKRDELDRLPGCDGAAGKPLDMSATIDMKLAKPAH